MPRPQRISIPGVTLHIVQRGNDRHRTFFADEDYRTYLLLLRRISRRYETDIHAYVLMTNHVHLLMTSALQGGISATMQQTGSSYARYINRQYQRTGTLWEGRFRSSAIDSDYYCLACYRYIELNPVRARIVDRPEEYRWSSYRENVGQRALTICKPHPSFRAIATSVEERFIRYRSLFRNELPKNTVDAIRNSTNRGAPTGSDAFREKLERQFGLALPQVSRGRPRRSPELPESTRGSRGAKKGL
jgi:putative transposase